ncbi:hypothetical protein HC016_04405 [Limosilactobacillus fermentum]
MGPLDVEGPHPVIEWHDHSFTHAAFVHAAFVLDGIFVNESQFDQTELYFGPGNFVCGPKGQIMRHGASPEQDCHCYFLTDQPFSLHYLDQETVAKARH